VSVMPWASGYSATHAAAQGWVHRGGEREGATHGGGATVHGLGRVNDGSAMCMSQRLVTQAHAQHRELRTLL
jgi:hypothetical protein